MKIDIKRKKIVFLGYGAVAKCVWNYFNEFAATQASSD